MLYIIYYGKNKGRRERERERERGRRRERVWMDDTKERWYERGFAHECVVNVVEFL